MEFFGVFFQFIADLFTALGSLKIGDASVSGIFLAFLVVSMVICFFWRGAKA